MHSYEILIHACIHVNADACMPACEILMHACIHAKIQCMYAFMSNLNACMHSCHIKVHMFVICVFEVATKARVIQNKGIMQSGGAVVAQ